MIGKCSVIIPVYNEEKNILKCMGVIKKQGYDNLEIIFIDDGSTDDSVRLITEQIEILSSLDIKLFSQKNGGAASARKNGILKAKGDFIAILDCDDELADDSIKSAMSQFEHNIDLVLFDLKYKSISNGKLCFKDFIYFTSDKKINGEQAFVNSLDTWGVHAFGILRKDIILKSYEVYENYNENNNFVNNDEIISRLNFIHSREIKISDGIYYYVENLESTTRRLNSNLYKQLFNIEILYEYILNERVEVCLDFLIAYTWGAARYYCANKGQLDNTGAWKEAIRKMIKICRRSVVLTKLTLKRKIQLVILVLVGNVL